jgi:hypothetical protein
MSLAAAIHKQLDPTAVIGMGTPYRSWHDALKARPIWYRAEGHLALRTHGELGETTAPVRILVHPEWVEIAPVVFCDANFIRREIDWHVQNDGSLCHVLAQQWRWQLGQWWEQGIEIGQLVDTAATWCCQNVDSLVTRHLHGHRIGLTKWPKLWRQWSHFQKGVDEFKNSISRAALAA